MAVTTGAARARKLIVYRYEATNSQGRLLKGTIKAVSEIDAERRLIARGDLPLNVEVAPSMFSLEEALPSLFRVKPRDVIIFSRQLATLLKSGISLLPAMEILSGQVTSSRAFKKILGSMVNDLGSGGSFAQSLTKHPAAFNEIYCRTITMGEQTGNMETVLHQMANYLEKQGETAGKIGKALTYPLMIGGVGIVVVIILMTVVMPQLMGMFSSLGVELPLPSRILIGISNTLVSYPLYFLTAGVLLVVMVLWLVKQPTGRRLLDRILITAPLIGTPILMGELARFSRTMATLISTGLGLQEIMELAPQSSSNRVIRDALAQVNERLLLGEGLAEPMSRIDLFPPLLVQMVAVGEESNTLSFSLGVVADFYETTSQEKMNAMVGMITPLATIGIALLVGFIAISVLMPMYAITGAFD